MPLPGVILTARYVHPNSNVFANYLNYMDRSAAVRNEMTPLWDATSVQNLDTSMAIASDQKSYDGMSDYMDNPVKTDELFGADIDRFNADQKQVLKHYFTASQQAQSPMWQLVFSFDNHWLEEQGLLQADQHQLNKGKIQTATRKAIQKLEETTGLRGQWAAAIHYNTDNLHVHIAYVEREPTREWIDYHYPKHPELSGGQYKGKLRVDALEKTKSAFTNELTNHQALLKRLDQTLKATISHARELGDDWYNERYRSAINELVNVLPTDKRKWQYGYAKGQHFKPQLDQIINLYLNHDGAQYVPKINKELNAAEAAYRRDHGATRRSYRENKLYGKNGLYARLGNAVLKQLKTHPFTQEMMALDYDALTRELADISLTNEQKQSNQAYQPRWVQQEALKAQLAALRAAHAAQVAAAEKQATLAYRIKLSQPLSAREKNQLTRDFQQRHQARLGRPKNARGLIYSQHDQRMVFYKSRGDLLRISRDNTKWSAMKVKQLTENAPNERPHYMSAAERLSRRRAYYARHQSVTSALGQLRKYLGKSTEQYLNEQAYRQAEQADQRQT